MDNQVNHFDRGQTFYGIGNTIDANNLGGVNLEGARKVFPNYDPSGPYGRRLRRDESDIRCILVRNVSGITLAPGQAVVWKAGYRNKRVDGYSYQTAQEIAGYVDDMLPSSGVPNNDMFWLIVEGQVLANTPLDGASFGGDWAEGDMLYALTAAASTGTTAGKMQRWPGTWTATQTTDGTATKFAANRVGRVMSAKTTAQTNSPVLIDVKKF
jgi:hypothetical protein